MQATREQLPIQHSIVCCANNYGIAQISCLGEFDRLLMEELINSASTQIGGKRAEANRAQGEISHCGGPQGIAVCHRGVKDMQQRTLL